LGVPIGSRYAFDLAGERFRVCRRPK